MIVPASANPMLATGGYQVTIHLTGESFEINLHALAMDAGGWDGIEPLQATFIVDAGSFVGSYSIGTPAMTTGNGYPVGSELHLINNGTIGGKGGAGGLGGQAGAASLPGDPGGDGGTGLDAQYAITITNNGMIYGGGGGGGGGGSTADAGAGPAGGCGGGGGTGLGDGGVASYYGPGSWANPPNPGAYGTAGTSAEGGTGGVFGGVYAGYMWGGPGGTGGGPGASGTSGGVSSANGDYNTTGPGVGGNPGNAVEGNARINWAVTGTRLGPIT